MTVLVTGATGTVGSAIVTRLVAGDRPVRALVRDPVRARPLLPRSVEAVRGDVLDPSSVRAALDGCAVVYHAAGLPEQWQADPGVFARVNDEGTRTVARAALEAGVVSFVFTSTIDVFTWPTESGRTFDESEIDPNPKRTAYERSKQSADRFVTECVDRGLPARIAAPAAVFGPAPLVTPGVNHLLARLLRREIPLLLPGGLPLVFAPDVAELHLSLENAPVGSRYIAADAYYSLVEIAEAIRDLAPETRVPPVLPRGVATIVAHLGEALSSWTGRAPLLTAGELQFLTSEVRPDASRATRDLGWRPTPFRDAIAETVSWLRRVVP